MGIFMPKPNGVEIPVDSQLYNDYIDESNNEQCKCKTWYHVLYYYDRTDLCNCC